MAVACRIGDSSDRAISNASCRISDAAIIAALSHDPDHKQICHEAFLPGNLHTRDKNIVAQPCSFH